MALGSLNVELLDFIMAFCATGCTVGHNQIAVASRRLNVAWRRMHYSLVRRLITKCLQCLEANRRMRQRIPLAAANTLTELHLKLADIDDVLCGRSEFPQGPLWRGV